MHSCSTTRHLVGRQESDLLDEKRHGTSMTKIDRSFTLRKHSHKPAKIYRTVYETKGNEGGENIGNTFENDRIPYEREVQIMDSLTARICS
jgi:hypothetical protein